MGGVDGARRRIVSASRRRLALGLPLLLSACAGTICSEATRAFMPEAIPPGCAVSGSSDGVALLACERGREGFAFLTARDIHDMDETR